MTMGTRISLVVLWYDVVMVVGLKLKFCLFEWAVVIDVVNYCCCNCLYVGMIISFESVLSLLHFCRVN